MLDNNLDARNARIRAHEADIAYAANARIALIIAHTGQEALSDDIRSPIGDDAESRNAVDLMAIRVLGQTELHGVIAKSMLDDPASFEM
jgi:hypothetical protein